MGVISKETLALIAIVRDNYPKTWTWAQHKAHWEHMCVGAIFEHWNITIKALMEEEKPNV
jgi:hypothetical protein